MTSSGARALRALQVVNAADEPLGVTAIAGAIDTLPGTAYRSLDALERGRFVERYRASTLYQTGPAATRLRQTLLAQFPLRNLATPFLRRLAVAASDTVSLTVPVGWHALRLVVIAGTNSVRGRVDTGLAGLLEESIAGRTILSDFDKNMMHAYSADIAPLDGADRASKELLIALREIAEQGYALEMVEGAGRSAIAMPVRHEGRVVAAVAIDGPVVKTGGENVEAEIAAWRAVVAEIEDAAAQTKRFSATPFGHLDPAAVNHALVGRPEGGDDEDDAD